MFFQCHVVKKIFQNLRMRLKFRIRKAMKIKIFVACEIQYFEIGMSSFNSYVYYLTRGFIAPTRAFNLLTRSLVSQPVILIFQFVLLILQLVFLVF